MKISIVKTDAADAEFIRLVTELDESLRITDGEDHHFYNQYNGLEHIHHVVLAYVGDVAVGCGAIKALFDHVMEVKRMYVVPEYRGQGIAVQMLEALEEWAHEMGNSKCMLETGIRQVAAIQLYKKSGYAVIENYGQYIGVQGSVCFSKKLK